MTFDHPLLLWTLVIPAAAIVVYTFVQRRSRRYTLRFTSLELLQSVAPERSTRRRHLPFTLLLVGAIGLSSASAKPVLNVASEQRVATLYLAMDVSLSMEATDVAPSRLQAAKDAAIGFVGSLPEDVKVSLISFSGTARTVVSPTDDRTFVTDAISGLTLEPGTAIGEAVFAALGAVASEPNPQAGPSSHIVVLSDGATTTGRSNEEAAQAATGLGVGVSTIAFGTPNGSVSVQGESIPVPVDRGALYELAQATGGRAATAESADELIAVFDDLERLADVATEPIDLAPALALAALIVLSAAGLVSVWTLGWAPQAEFERPSPERRAA